MKLKSKTFDATHSFHLDNLRSASRVSVISVFHLEIIDLCSSIIDRHYQFRDIRHH